MYKLQAFLTVYTKVESSGLKMVRRIVKNENLTGRKPGTENH